MPLDTTISYNDLTAKTESVIAYFGDGDHSFRERDHLFRQDDHSFRKPLISDHHRPKRVITILRNQRSRSRNR